MQRLCGNDREILAVAADVPDIDEACFDLRGDFFDACWVIDFDGDGRIFIGAEAECGAQNSACVLFGHKNNIVRAAKAAGGCEDAGDAVGLLVDENGVADEKVVLKESICNIVADDDHIRVSGAEVASGCEGADDKVALNGRVAALNKKIGGFSGVIDVGASVDFARDRSDAGDEFDCLQFAGREGIDVGNRR